MNTMVTASKTELADMKAEANAAKQVMTLSPPTVVQALSAVMNDVGAVTKGDRNEHQKFLFRGIDSVVNAVSPALRKHGVVVVPQVLSTTYDAVQTSTGKPATACRVAVRYTFYGPAGDSIKSEVAAEAWDNGDKAAPKAMSVAFRIALLQTLSLPTDDKDPDHDTYERAATPTPQPVTMQREQRSGGGSVLSGAQRGKIIAMMNELGMTDRTSVLAYCSDVVGRPVESRSHLTPKEASQVIDALQQEGKP